MSSGSSEIVGKSAQLTNPFKGSVGAFCGIIRPKFQELDRFLYYWFQSDNFLRWRNKAARGANIQNLRFSALEEIQIPLPPPPEQKRIAALLEKADRVRRLRRYAREMSEGFLQSVFREMFGDLSLSAYSFNRLGDEADIASGVTIGQRYKTNDLISVPYLRVANVKDGYLDLSEIKYVSVPKQEADSLYLKPRDILMTEGGDFDKLGRGCIWKGEIADCIHQNHVFRVRFTTGAVSPELFSVYLRSPHAKAYFLSCAKQTTNLASINMTQLKDTPVPILPIKQQAAFLKIRQDYLRLERQNTEAERQAEHLFQTLLHQAFAEG